MIRKILHRILYRHTVVLMYHRIARPVNDHWQLCVSPGNFEQQLQVISRHKKNIIITFDDGYIDNYTVAKPLLEKYQLPATFFIATGNIDSGKEFWWDELEQLIPGHEQYLEKWNELFPLPYQQQQQSVSPRKEYLCMSSTQLKEISANELFTIGAHTVHHPALAHQSEAVQKEEIQQSIEWLYQLTGKKPDTLAYPYGNYNEATINIASGLGLKAAYTTEPRIVTKTSPRYQLGRFQVMDWNGAEFEKQLEGWLNM
ncbi:MAG TPA: polysaccharide deacetylase family protein [Chitinophagaceae bacterium]|nr:polysaccharide deacetylase family protein [Chitinophagaceae bacterium]